MKVTQLAKDLQPLWQRDIDAKVQAALSRTVIATGRATQSGGGTSYTAGDAIDIASNVISVDVTDLLSGDYGLEEDTNNLRVKLAGTSALEFSTGLRLKSTLAGDGLDMSSQVLSITEGVGLEMNSTVLRVHLWGVGGPGVTDSGLVMDNDGLRVATALAGSGLSMQNDPRVLSVGAGDGIDVAGTSVAVDVTDLLGTGITESGTNNIAVDQTYNFGWSGTHNFTVYNPYIGRGLEMQNREQADVPAYRVSSANGILYFDQNVPDTDLGGASILTGSDKGGMVLYNPDDTAYGLLIDTTNMVNVNAKFPSVRTPIIYSDAHLKLEPTGFIWHANDKILRTNTYQDLWAGIEGYRIRQMDDARSLLTIGRIKAEELSVRFFTADETRVTRGEQIWSRSFGIVAQAFDLPADEATVNVWFEDAPGVSGDIFAAGNWLLCRMIDWNTGLEVSSVWFQAVSWNRAYNIPDLATYLGLWTETTLYGTGQHVTYGGLYYVCISGHTASLSNRPGTGENWSLRWELTAARDWQQWEIRRKSGGTTGQEIGPGAVMVDLGTTGQGWIQLTALETSDGPHIAMGDWSGSDPSVISNWDTFLRLGNLNGFAGYATDTIGLAVGQNFESGDATTYAGIVVAEDAVKLYNAPLDFYNGGYLRGRIFNTGAFVFGYAGATTDVTTANAGLYFAAASGLVRMGPDAGPKIEYNGSTSLDLTRVGLTFNDGSYDRGVMYSTGTWWFGGPSGAGVNSYNASIMHVATDGITVGGETYNRGDVRIGSQAGANMHWDASDGTLEFRYMEGDAQVYIDTDGSMKAGGGVVQLGSNGIALDVNDDLYEQESSIDFVKSGTTVASLYTLNITGGSSLARLRLDSGGGGYTGGIFLNVYDGSSNNLAMLHLGEGLIGLGLVGSSSIGIDGTSGGLDGDWDVFGDFGVYGTSNISGALALRDYANSAWRSILSIDSGENLVIGAGIQAADQLRLQIAAADKLVVSDTFVRATEILRMEGDDTITSNPTAAGSISGWKASLYTGAYAIGVDNATETFAIKTPKWFAVFDSQNPAGSGSPDSNYTFAVCDSAMHAEASVKIGGAWTAVGLNTGGNWANTNTSTYYATGYRQFGDIVFLRGNFSRSSGSGAATVASAVFPAPARTIWIETSGATLRIDTSGNLLFDAGDDDNISLEGLSYPMTV